MQARARVIEVAAVIVLLSVSAALIGAYGKSNRHILPSRHITEVTLPQDAFPLWNRFGVHGRILILMDRYLNADELEHGTYAFTPSEFTGSNSMEALCSAIRHDSYNVVSEDFPCTVKGLNALLETSGFYDAWQQKYRSMSLPAEVMTKLWSMRGTKTDYANLPDEWKSYVLEINRTILEQTYPFLCPKKTPSDFIGTDNYLYRGIREGYLRKIYHVIPDESWSEVSDTLDRYKMVSRSAGTFRMTIDNFTPVIILRLKDLPTLSEEVLLSINSSYWTPETLAPLKEKMQQGSIQSDLITIAGPQSAAVYRLLTDI